MSDVSNSCGSDVLIHTRPHRVFIDFVELPLPQVPFSQPRVSFCRQLSQFKARIRHGWDELRLYVVKTYSLNVPNLILELHEAHVLVVASQVLLVKKVSTTSTL